MKTTEQRKKEKRRGKKLTIRRESVHDCQQDMTKKWEENIKKCKIFSSNNQKGEISSG